MTTGTSFKRQNSLPNSQASQQASDGIRSFAKSKLESLPAELCLMVFANLDLGSLLNLGQTSRFFREQVNTWIKIKATKLPEGFLVFTKEGKTYSAKNRPSGSSLVKTSFFKMDTSGCFAYENDSIDELARLVKEASLATKLTKVFLNSVEITADHLALLQKASTNPFRNVEKCVITLSVMPESSLQALLQPMQKVRSLSCAYLYEDAQLDFSLLENLEDLSLSPTNLTVERQERLFTQLDRLKLPLRSLSFDVGLLGRRIYAKFNRFVSLEKLSLRCSRESLEGISKMHLPLLREFSFQSPTFLFEEADIHQLHLELRKFLEKHPNLIKLCLNDFPLKDEIVSYLPKNLKHLEIKNTLIGKEGLKALQARCQELESLLASYIPCKTSAIREVFGDTGIRVIAYGLVLDEAACDYPSTLQVQDPFDSD